MSLAPAVVVVGAAARDVARDDRRGWRLGGGVTYAALTVGRLGLRVGALVGVDAEAALADELDLLRAADVEVVLAPLAHGPVFVNRETPAGRRQTAVDISDGVPLAALPRSWRDAEAWLLVPVAAELPDDWAEVPPAQARVAVGWQGFLRGLVAGKAVTRTAPRRSPIIERADLVGVSLDDLAPATDVDALLPLLKPGATLLLTDGIRGGEAVTTGTADGPARRLSWAGVPAARIVDPTGAGDTFLAALLASLVDPTLGADGVRVDRRTAGGPVAGRSASGAIDRRDLVFAAAAASLVIEAPGLHSVADRDAVRRRMRVVTGPG